MGTEELTIPLMFAILRTLRDRVLDLNHLDGSGELQVETDIVVIHDSICQIV
jgi:hypothetical protein